MRVLIELPTWLGDAVMTTPAIESIISNYKNVEITIIGSNISTEVLKNHPKITHHFILEKNYLKFYKFAKKIGKFDKFFSFRESFRSKILKLFISSEEKFQFNKSKYANLHQVEKYSKFVNKSLGVKLPTHKLKIYTEKLSKNKKNKRPIVGINPGASYGSSKRWLPEKFAEVAAEISVDYDILIFGNINEVEIGKEIEKKLKERNIKNYQNLSGRTSFQQLLSSIMNLDLFVTGDSGPMHLAAAFEIPTVAIFGPTNPNETSQWMNKKNIIVKKNLNCQPCMRRRCPLNHNNCMKLITSREVINAIKFLD